MPDPAPALDLDALERMEKDATPREWEAALRNAAPGLIAAARERDEIKAQLEKLERDDDKTMHERDDAEDALQAAHLALGGDGEWCGKSPPEPPPTSGDLAQDVPALARLLAAELARLREVADELLAKAKYGGKLYTGEPMTVLEADFIEEEIVPWLRAALSGAGKEENDGG